MTKRKTTKKAHRKPNNNTIEEVNPRDPIFAGSPSAKRTGKVDYGSQEHDKHLYN